MSKRTAIIDIGSNSVRMVVFEKTSRFAFHLLHEVKSRVRISEDAYENDGNLQEAPMERALLALRDFLNIAASYSVRKTLCVATSAVRDAPNKQTFLQQAKKDLRLNIKVIDGEKEAYFGGIACANLLPQADGVTIDIGGGSTELAYIEKGRVIRALSLKLGTVRLKELYFDRNDREGALHYIDSVLEGIPIEAYGHAMGIGGTFRAIARALLKRSEHPLKKLHAYPIDGSTMQDYLHSILSTPDDAALKKLGIKKDRYDVIHPGALILSRLLERLHIQRLTTSGVGVREGVFLSDLLRTSHHRFPEHFNPSMRYLIDRYCMEPHHVENISKVSKTLFDLLHSTFALPQEHRKALSIAAKLSKTGNTLHYYSLNQHSYYLAQTALEYGFTHEEIMLISTLVRFQKKKRPTKSHMNHYGILLPAPATVELLSYMLSLADALLSHHPRHIDFNINFSEGVLTITPKGQPLYLAIENVKALERPKALKIQFQS